MSSNPLTETDLRHEVGKRLRLEREARGLSVRAAGARADIAPSHLSGIERGESIPSLAVLAKLVSVYETSMQRFLGQIGTPPPAFGSLDDTPGWRELSEPRLSMQIFQVVLHPRESTSMQLTQDGDVLIYVLTGDIVFETEVESVHLARQDSLKARHLRGASWSNLGSEPARMLLAVGPSARVSEANVSEVLAGSEGL